MSNVEAQSSMSFIENKGQWLSSIEFKSELNFGNIYFEKDNFTFILIENEEHNHNSEHFDDESEEAIKGHHFKMKFLGANDVEFESENQSLHYYNYFLGNNPSHWASKVHAYKSIKYKNLYSGIDMKVMGQEDDMKYEYYIAPFADPDQIKVQYLGLDKLELKNGNLVYKTQIADITETEPIVYQIINEQKVYVKCKYKLDKKTKIVTYEFPDGYEESLELIIDPTLIFTSYTGSTLNNFGYTATYDNEGNLFGGGIVFGNLSGLTGYPSINSFNLLDTTYGGPNSYYNGFPSDISISKFSDDGTTLLYSTLIGGSDSEQPQSLVTDSIGNLFIYGRSYSANFPVSVDAYDTTFNGNSDIVILKISSDGTSLLGSTFVGGTLDDGSNGNSHPGIYDSLKYNYADDGRGEIILDVLGNVYVASTTKSFDIFSDTTSFQTTFGGGSQDACVFKLNTNLSSLVWGSFLGGSDQDAGYSLKLDNIGHLFVTGGTKSFDFPSTSGGLNSIFQGGQADGYLAKIDTNGSVLIQSTYLGTSSYDQSYFVEIDEFNDIYTYGQTLGDYLVEGNVYFNNNSTQFIHKLTNDLDSTIFSTVFGNNDSLNVNISPTAFLVDYCGNIYISGWGGSTNNSSPYATGNTLGMPITIDALQNTTDGSDFYIMVLGKDAESLLYATFYGGNQSITGGSGEHVDGGTSRFDKNGVIYQAVCASCSTNSNNFPTTAGSWSQTSNSGTGCNLGVIKMNVYIPPTIVQVDASPTATGCVPLSVNFESDLVNVNLITWDFGDGNTSNIEDPVHLFTDTGTFIIRLIGEDTTLCNLADTAYLTVVVDDDTLIAEFIDNAVISCDELSFSATAYNYSTTQFLWSMGDGTTYTSDSVYHEYTNPGIYTISLLITDSTSCELIDSTSTTIEILPSIDASFHLLDTFGCLPHFSSFINTTNIGVDSLLWNFGDGTSSSILNPIHEYVNIGNYSVSLIAFDTNTCNLTDTAFASVIVVDDRVVADIQTDTLFYECDSLIVRFSSLNANVTSYDWDFDNGTISSDSTVDVTFIAGNYDGRYIVTDTTLICKPIDTLEFNYTLLPEIHAGITLNDTFGCVSLQVAFTNLTNITVTDYSWNFGDGNTSFIENPTNTYINIGNYQVEFIASDTNTCNLADTVYANVTSIDDRVVADIQTDTLFYECDSLIMRFSSLNANVTSYDWDFDNGTISSDSTVDVTFIAGNYDGRYIVTDTTLICKPIDTIEFNYTLLPEFHFTSSISDSSGCLPLNVFFNASIDYPVDSFAWYYGDGNSAEFLSVAYTYTIEGNYTATFYAIDSNTCNISDSAQYPIIVNNDIAIATIAVNETPFACDSLVVNFQADSLFGEHFWDFGDGSTSDLSIINHTYFNYGIYDVVYILFDSTKACNPYDTAFYQVKFEELIANISLNDSSGCIPFDYTYNSSTIAEEYAWDFGNGNTSSAQSGIYTYDSVGIFNLALTVTDSSTCNITDVASTTIITEDSRVIADFDYTILSDCDGLLSVQINNQSINAVNYSWFLDNLINSNLEEPGIFNFTSLGFHSISLIAENDTLCNVTDTMLIVLELKPNAFASFDIENNCENRSVEIINTSLDSDTYFWNFGNGESSTEQNPNFVYSESGDYVVMLTITDSSSCNITNTVSETVSILDYANADFITDSITYLYPDDVIFTNLSSNYDSFLWSFGDGQTENEELNPVHFYNSIIYDIEPCLSVFNEYCGDTICKNIYIDFEELIGVPNAFSPNADGINDIIYVEGIGITSLNFKIYNRWGELVFESNDQSIGWNGKYKNIDQEMEVYTYVVEAIFLNDKSAILKGNITLLR